MTSQSEASIKLYRAIVQFKALPWGFIRTLRSKHHKVVRSLPTCIEIYSFCGWVCPPPAKTTDKTMQRTLTELFNTQPVPVAKYTSRTHIFPRVRSTTYRFHPRVPIVPPVNLREFLLREYV